MAHEWIIESSSFCVTSGGTVAEPGRALPTGSLRAHRCRLRGWTAPLFIFRSLSWWLGVCLYPYCKSTVHPQSHQRAWGIPEPPQPQLLAPNPPRRRGAELTAGISGQSQLGGGWLGSSGVLRSVPRTLGTPLPRGHCASSQASNR